MVLNFKNAKDIKSYLYQSKAKIDEFYQQIRDSTEKRTIKWKIDLGFLSREFQKERDGELNYQEKQDAVVAALEKRELLGPPESGKPYLRARLPMKWGLFDDHNLRQDTDGPLVYFSCLDDGLLIGLGGSSVHVGSPYGIGATSSRSCTAALYNWLVSGLNTGNRPLNHHFDSEIVEGMVFANHYLKGITQEVEFVAKVLWRGKGCRLQPHDNECTGEVILGTPLYVAQVTRIHMEMSICLDEGSLPLL